MKQDSYFEVRDIRIKEKFVVDDAYLNGYAKHCGIVATGCYMVLCRHSNVQQICFPSKDLIAEKLGISVRSVYNGLKILEHFNIIKIEANVRADNGNYLSHRYILLDKSEWKSKPSATGAVGTEQHEPSATGAIDHRQLVPTKELIKEKELKTEGENPLASAWNAVAKSFSRVDRCGKARSAKIAARLKERSIPAWQAVFERMEQSDFLKGKNDRGFKADFDWIIQNENNSEKVMAGRYDNRNGGMSHQQKENLKDLENFHEQTSV